MVPNNYHLDIIKQKVQAVKFLLFPYFLEIFLNFPPLGKNSYFFLLFKILGRVQCVILSVLYVLWCVGFILRGVYKSALCQGQASCALNLPSCRCTEMGQMSLEGTYWGEGFPSAFWVCKPTQNVQGKRLCEPWAIYTILI